MGNQHEISQISPTHIENGVAIKVKQEHLTQLKTLHDNSEDDFYTILVEENDSKRIPNLDSNDFTVFGEGAFMAIQSGGKMWSGYVKFINFISKVSPFLNDAIFYVADEIDFVDKFAISNGSLIYERVHEGSWYPLDKYFEEHGLL